MMSRLPLGIKETCGDCRRCVAFGPEVKTFTSLDLHSTRFNAKMLQFFISINNELKMIKCKL